MRLRSGLLLLLVLPVLCRGGTEGQDTPIVDGSHPQTGQDQVAEESKSFETFVPLFPSPRIASPPASGDKREGGEASEAEVEDSYNFDISPADELRTAAMRSGYNISDVMLNLATTGTEEEITEMLPKPLAEALIDRRRRPDMRDRMIGMTFLGQPIALDRRNRRPFGGENRRRMKLGPKRRQQLRRHNDFSTSGGGGGFKLPRTKRPHQQRIPVVEQESTSTSFSFGSSSEKRRPPSSPFRGGRKRPPQSSFQGPQSRPFKRPNGDGSSKFGDRPSGTQPFEVFDLREESAHNTQFDNRSPLDKFPRVKDGFGNSVGPDFGPVIYEFEHNLDDDMQHSFSNFDSPKQPGNKNSRPSKTSTSSSVSRRPTPFSARPKEFSPSKPFSTSFTSFGGKHSQSSFGGKPSQSSFGVKPSQSSFGGKPSQSISNSIRNPFGSRGDKKSGCRKYTETICLDAENYPHSEILASLEGDKARTNVLMAEVRNQSADNLVDGVSARQEQLYDYSHYFGNSIRRQDTEGHRDFADEGGYLCPSEVKYARPKRAKNSKGQWKFIVNMDKYTQTIRMQKCIQPGGACSYVSHHYQATCNQIHNYQRLLSWEKKRGLHMDIYKVPSCCTCHIQGYSFVFPPLDEDKKKKKSHQNRAGSHTVESRRLPSHPLHGRGLNRMISGKHFTDGEFPGPMSNGGPFTTAPLSGGGRRMQTPPFRTSHNRRQLTPASSTERRRMNVAESFESRRNFPRGGNRRIGGGGLSLSEMSSVPFEERPTIGDMDHGEMRAFGRPHRAPDRGPGEAMQTSQSSINYDYHPILQFFENYPQK